MSFGGLHPRPGCCGSRGVTQGRIKLWLARAHEHAGELTPEALKEMGIKKMGHRQAIVGAVMGK